MEDYNLNCDKIYKISENKIIYIRPVPYGEYIPLVGLIEQLITDNIPNRVDDIHIQPMLTFYPFGFGQEKSLKVSMIFGLKGFIKSPEYRVDKSIAIDYVLESYMIDSKYNIPAKDITEYFSRGIINKLNEIVQYTIKFAKTGKLEIAETGDII
jgi:hypothetical protein